MADNELARLRAEVRKRRAAATKKVARMRREKGVNITGTPHDPRRSIKAVNKYNSAQLRSYLNQLNTFQSRNVGYVAGINGVPLPKAAWERYKRAERTFNKIGQANSQAISNVNIPGKGMTAQERKDVVVPTRMSAAGDAANGAYTQHNRQPSNIKNLAALERLYKSFQKKIDPKYLPQQIRKARRMNNRLLDELGYGEFKSRIAKLSQHQMDYLWNHTDYASRLSSSYESMKKRWAGNEERYQNTIEDNAEWDIEELIESAEGLPRNAPKK